MLPNMLPGAYNLFDRMSVAGDDEIANRLIIENIIFEGGAVATASTSGVAMAAYNLEETQSQDGRAPFIPATYDQAGMDDAFMHHQVGLGSFPLDHEFPEDYSLEEEDEMNIDREPLFEDELANQARVKPKRKSKRTKAYMPYEDKLLCECWRDMGQDPKVGAEQKTSIFWLRVHCEYHEHKKFAPYRMQSKHGWVSLSEAMVGDTTRVQQVLCHP